MEWAELFSRGESYRRAADDIRAIQQALINLHAFVPDDIIDRMQKAEHELFNVASYASQRHEEYVLEAKKTGSS